MEAPETEEVFTTDIPDVLQASISESLSNYSVGFVRLDDAELLGSGTLVSIGSVRAILTAWHVVRALPETGRMGLVLSQQLHATTVDAGALRRMKVAYGGPDLEEEGPDLGALVVDPSISGLFEAKKSFCNLDRHRAAVMSTPRDIRGGVWVISGFVAENTLKEPGRFGFKEIRGFNHFTGIGGVEPAVTEGDFDYHHFPVEFGLAPAAPIKFGGMSGGGLWQVPLEKTSSGTLSHGAPILSGVAFFQGSVTVTSTILKCHGRQSIYRAWYDAVRAA